MAPPGNPCRSVVSTPGLTADDGSSPARFCFGSRPRRCDLLAEADELDAEPVQFVDEGRLIQNETLIEGMLTVFSGIPFGRNNPYNYLEAKRVLRLAMDELRRRSDLKNELGMDPDASGRSAITGRESTRIWDFLRLRQSRNATSFTEFPHLTLCIQQEQLFALVTVPHGIRRELRKSLLSSGISGFRNLLAGILENFDQSLGNVPGAAPWVEIIQRRYPSQRAEPITDARLQFDLRTSAEGASTWRMFVKEQPQWLTTAYDVLSNKNSNIQLGVGAIFRYEKCPAVHSAQILDCVASVWLGCKPLIDAMIRAD